MSFLHERPQNSGQSHFCLWRRTVNPFQSRSGLTYTIPNMSRQETLKFLHSPPSKATCSSRIQDLQYGSMPFIFVEYDHHKVTNLGLCPTRLKQTQLANPTPTQPNPTQPNPSNPPAVNSPGPPNPSPQPCGAPTSPALSAPALLRALPALLLLHLRHFGGGGVQWGNLAKCA